jgi:putative DNA primase/helicase
MRAAVAVSPEAIPVEIREIPNWVVWKYVLRDGKWTKPPFDAKTGRSAKSTDPSTWTTFGQALKTYTETIGVDG